VSKVTLLDIARECGVSRATVSLVLQDSSRVSGETKARVREAMAPLGYVYNRRAANLRTRRSMIVGLVVTDVRNHYFAELIMAVELALHDCGYIVLQGFSHDEPDRQGLLLAAMSEYRDDGPDVGRDGRSAGRPKDATAGVRRRRWPLECARLPVWIRTRPTTRAVCARRISWCTGCCPPAGRMRTSTATSTT